MRFEEEYVASEEIKEELLKFPGRNALITGKSGVGKTTLALIRANLIVSEELVDDPKTADIEMIHSSRLGGGAAAIQQLLSDVARRFHKNVIIIDEFHTLSLPAMEAFLPILDQNNATSQYTKWIFTTTNPEKLPPAVVSRLYQINLKAPDYETLIEFPRFRNLKRSQWAKHGGNIRSIINNELGGASTDAPIDWNVKDYVENMVVALDGGRDLYREAVDFLSTLLNVTTDPLKAAKIISTLTFEAVKADDIVMRNIITVESMAKLGPFPLLYNKE